jgi:hypothetical protein
MIGSPFLAGAVLLAAGVLAAPARTLSGNWLFGADGPEPKAGVVVVPPRCWNADVAVRLVDSDGKLTGTITWIPAMQGVPPARGRNESERLTGTRVGDQVRMTGEHRVTETTFALAYHSMPAGPPTTTITRVRYELRVDGKTGHLVGTRDGRPFWLAPVKVRPGHCGSPPP